MKYKIYGVAVFPVSGKAKIILDRGNYSSDKMKTYGLNPLEKWTSDHDVITTAIKNIGVECDIQADITGSIVSIKN